MQLGAPLASVFASTPWSNVEPCYARHSYVTTTAAGAVIIIWLHEPFGDQAHLLFQVLVSSLNSFFHLGFAVMQGSQVLCPERGCLLHEPVSCCGPLLGC